MRRTRGYDRSRPPRRARGAAALRAAAAAAPDETVATPHDLLGRALREVRISVTDRCNFRCTYCMPRSQFGPGHRFLGRDDLLTPAEVERLAAVVVSLGVEKVRLTGGEPLLRPELAEIVAGVAALPLRDLALTTNGALLRRHAARLRDAGLRRVTVSLDSLNGDVFAAMSDSGVALADVLDGVAAARDAGLSPVKLNCVVRRGVNAAGVLDLARFGREQGLTVRFIEYMDVGTTNGWRMDQVVPAADVVAAIDAALPLDPVAGDDPSAVARRYRYRDGGGEVGVIASVTQPFCHGCTRARITADGRLFTCLFASRGLDLRTPLRDGATDPELRALVGARWGRRDDRYSELRTAAGSESRRAEMSYIGG